MNGLTLARALHIVSIVIWIGGVAFVTAVMLPAIKSQYVYTQQESIFHLLEARFAKIAKWMVTLAGLSGFYMVDELNAWDRFTQIKFFWMHAMVLVWCLFFLALFVIEPFFLKSHGRMVKDGHNISNLYKTQIVHSIILTPSLITIVISVLGAHGFFFS